MKTAGLAKPDAEKALTKTETFSMSQLAEILGMSKVAIHKRAAKGKWPFEEVSVKGGRKKLFSLETLPAEVRKQILIHYGQIPESLVDCVPADMDQAKIERCSQAWDQARDWQRERARARQQILQSWRAYESRSSRKSKRDKAIAFCDLYARQDPSLRLDSSVFETQKSVKRTQLYQWEKDWKERGISGLISRHGHNRGQASMSMAEQRFVLGCAAMHPNYRPPHIHRAFRTQFPDSRVTVRQIRRFLHQRRSQDPAVFRFLKNPDACKSQYQPAAGNQTEVAQRFLHYVQVDSTVADVRCQHPKHADGKRPRLVALIDVFSRKAIVRVCETSSSAAIAGILRDCCQRFGIPENWIRDNGKDYTADHINDALDGLEINAITAPPFSPETKGLVERFYLTISHGLFEMLPGYCGHNVADAQAIRSRHSFAQRFSGKVTTEKLLTPQEFQALIDDWLDTIYHQENHGGIGFSPKAKASSAPHLPRRIEDERAPDILLAPIGFRRVHKKGIRHNSLHYWDDELAGPWMGRQVKIRVNPWDVGRVYVFNPDTGEFICEAKDPLVLGHTPEDYARVVKRWRRDVRERVRALQELGKQITDPVTTMIEQAQERSGKIFNLPVGETVQGNPAVDGVIAAADADRKEAATLAKLQDPKTFLPVEPPQPEHPKVVQLTNRTQFTPETPTRRLFRNQLERFFWSLENHGKDGYTEADDAFLKINRAHWESYADAFKHEWSDADRDWLNRLCPDRFAPGTAKEDDSR